MGWYLDYVGRLVKTFPSFTLAYVEDELPMAQGWAFYSWAIENDGFLCFAGVQRASEGYVKQEMKRIASERN